ncbi:MAG: carbohydrate-binding domain-containing protein [Anaerolineae bacterium]|nr:carbohydrate-binding domain-containing protein [Anaerolineae bacterium]
MKVRQLAGAVAALMVGLSSMSMASAQEEITFITLNGASGEVAGGGAAAESGMITISDAGTYSLSGALNDGQILINAPEDAAVTLILNGVTISSSISAPIYAQSASVLTVTLAEGSENTLNDAAEYVYASEEDDEPEAALFSDVDLIINGTGSLIVNANFQDGISTDDSLTISDNPIIIINAVDDALRGNDAITINGGVYTLNASEGDGLKSSEQESVILIEGGNFTITAEDDGVQSDRDFTMNAGEFVITAGGDGIHSEYNLVINDGSINVLDSEEGIEGAFIVINGGEIRVVSTDDGINVSAPDDAEITTTNTAPAQGQPGGFMGDPNSPYYLHINGGYIVVSAEGDGLDSNGSIEMTGGVVIVNGPTGFDNGTLDYDLTFNISGGLLIAAGSAGMPQAPGDSSSQFSMLINYAEPYSPGTLVHIQTSDGEEILTFAPAKAFQSVVFSSPELTQGVTYDIYSGGSSSGIATDGLYADGAYTPGTLFETVTITNSVTYVGEVRRQR